MVFSWIAPLSFRALHFSNCYPVFLVGEHLCVLPFFPRSLLVINQKDGAVPTPRPCSIGHLCLWATRLIQQVDGFFGVVILIRFKDQIATVNLHH